MKDIEIRFSKKSECKKLELLSKMFANENCCNNIKADPENYFYDKKVAVAIWDGEIIGYCYGMIEKETKQTSYSNVDDIYYDLEEIYIIPNFRDMGVGIKIFKFIEDYAKKEGCKTLRLAAVSKDYKKLLNFYINKLDMDFISAYLVKKI